MAYYDHDRRYHDSRRHDPYNLTSRDSDRYSSRNNGGYSSSYNSYEPHRDAYAAPPSLPKRSSAYSYCPTTSSTSSSRTRSNRPRWPPGPSVEDEKASLEKEVKSQTSSSVVEDEFSGEAKSRGTVDQYPILEEIEQPKPAPNLNGEKRFVLVSDPSEDADSTTSSSAAREHRRKSFAERGNMPYLNTKTEDPPVIIERTSTPYSYTKPQKESLAPTPGEYFLSPESIAPSSTSIPRSVPTRDQWESQRDQNARPSRSIPIHNRNDSFTQSPRTPKNDVFDSDSEAEDTTHLRTARKPARYSFVKSDLQKEDLRTNIRDSQAKSDRDRAPPASSSRAAYDSSSGSSKNPTPGSQSPRSSTSSLNNGTHSRQRPHSDAAESRRDRGTRGYPERPLPSRPESPARPNSPLRYEHPPSPPRSPKLPPRRTGNSPPTSRPSSRSGPRPPSPLSSTTMPPLSPSVPVSETDWHSTYPPVTAGERTRPQPRFSRYDSMPVPMPRIDVQSPSPARKPDSVQSPLPYPVDDRPTDVFMPPEEAFQFDHNYAPPSPTLSFRQAYPDSPKLPSSPKVPPSPVPGSPRGRSSNLRPSVGSRNTVPPEELPRLSRNRSNSARSQSSVDGRRSERQATAPLSLDKPMPSCPRAKASGVYDDWYTLDGCPSFDICPSCYNGVFAETSFAVYFKPVRRFSERFCDFSSPWMRLAWLLTIQQQRKSPDLLYQLATISETDLPCPGEREVTGGVWYGIPDQRDGIHVSNFAICPCDYKMIEALFPSMRGYLKRWPGISRPQACSLRTGSRRFPKYLDVLVEIDAESQLRSRAPDIQRFINVAREYAFKSECNRDTPLKGRPWHFIPNLPEFTVCEECYGEIVWPAIKDKNRVAALFHRSTQLVPGEDNEGSSCCLYSPRMRRVFARAIEDSDLRYLERKAIERKRMESRVNRKKTQYNRWLDNMTKSGDYGSKNYERLTWELGDLDQEWKDWE